MQANHHHHRGRGDFDAKLGFIGAEHVDQRIVDDLDHLLARCDRLEHLLPDRLLGDLVDEIADDGERHVRLEQGDPHLAHRRAHVRFVERTAAAQAIENAAKAIS